MSLFEHFIWKLGAKDPDQDQDPQVKGRIRIRLKVIRILNSDCGYGMIFILGSESVCQTGFGSKPENELGHQEIFAGPKRFAWCVRYLYAIVLQKDDS
jgi:hypothetical protein